LGALLEARDVHAHYGESHVLRGVSIAINAGEAIGLLGRNGMGKTTLIRTLIGLTRASGGSVLVQGRDCTNERPHRIARMGVAYVPEGRGIFPNLSVRENLLFAARPPSDARTGWTCERVLETFPRLKERLAAGGHQLSGGEQQMLAIGRALMTNPRLLILDEATEGLAPLIRGEIWNCLSLLKARGQSVLVIDKNVENLSRIADRHYIIERGRAVWSGTSEQLIAEPDLQHRYLGI
jgi:branched-chain amino acid transport system ATP-binding protein